MTLWIKGSEWLLGNCRDINSDDLIADPAAIEKVVKCFEDDGSIDAVYADLYYVAQMTHLR